LRRRIADSTFFDADLPYFPIACLRVPTSLLARDDRHSTPSPGSERARAGLT
jgi:hypothetical protein